MIDESELNSLIRNYFICDENREETERILTEAIKLGLDFKTGKVSDQYVVKHREQQEIMDKLLEPIPEEGKSLDEIVTEFKSKVLDGSVNFSSPHFIAFPDCGNSIAGMSAHILYAMTNQNLINSVHTSPTATFVEIAVVNWLRGIVGYQVVDKPRDVLDVGGISVTGGVSANVIGMMLARENKFPGTIAAGLKYDPEKIK